MTGMVDQQFAAAFAADWVAAWNMHDLDRVLAHYADDFVMSSPKIMRIANEPSGVLHGKAAVRAYWAKALQMMPELHFELQNILLGVGSLVLYYTSVSGQLAAEVFLFDPQGKVTRSFAHYVL